jgi:predicted dinucleotide-binding enzyme
MKIGVLGSGMVGQAIASKLVERGQQVMISSRNLEKVKDFTARVPGVQMGSFSQAAAHGEVLFNALKGEATLEVLSSVDAGSLQGKILIDISNPLDFSRGMPPSLYVCNTDSLGEQIQAAFPQLKVIKTLNTLNANLMVNPGSLAGGDHTLFMSGNDEQAKEQVRRLFGEWFGWRDIIDVGDITTARGTEALLALWVRLFMKFGSPNFQFKVVR